VQRSASLIASAALLLSIITATAIAAHYATPTRGQPSVQTISATKTPTITNISADLIVEVSYPNGSRLASGTLSAGSLSVTSNSSMFTFAGIKPGSYALNLTGVNGTYFPPTTAQVVAGANVLNLTVYQLATFDLVDTSNLAFNGSQPGPVIDVNNGTAVTLVIRNNTTQVFNVAVVDNLFNTSVANVLFNSLSSTISAGGSVNDTFITSGVGTFYYQSMTGNQAKQGEYGYFTVSPS
jgi:hypothetical protein